MKMVHVLATSVVVLSLVGCGGGGGGSDSAAPATTAAVVAPAAGPLCPDGSVVPAKGTTFCPFVNISAPTTISSVDPKTFTQGLTVQYNGELDPASIMKNVVLWQGAVDTGTSVAGTTSLAGGSKDLTFVPTQRLAYGQSFVLAINVTDSVGRPVSSTVPFTSTPMVCADNAIWSNPATFSTVYKNCVAGVGVQAKVDQVYNKMQDTTCTLTLGAPLSAACKAYMDNGTMLLANTSIVANSHLTTWMAYVGTDGKSNLVLLDTNDPADASPAPVASLVLPSSLSWIIGNTTGASIKTVDGKTSRASLDGANNIVLTCLVGC